MSLLRDLERIRKALIPKPQEAKRRRIAKLLERDAGLTDTAVAKKIGSTDVHTVAAVRRKLAEAGRIPPVEIVIGKAHRIYNRNPQRVPKWGEKRRRIAALLEADPDRSNASIRREIGKTDAGTIAKVRRELVEVGRIPPVEAVIGPDGRTFRLHNRRF